DRVPGLRGRHPPPSSPHAVIEIWHIAHYRTCPAPTPLANVPQPSPSSEGWLDEHRQPHTPCRWCCVRGVRRQTSAEAVPARPKSRSAGSPSPHSTSWLAESPTPSGKSCSPRPES